MPALIGPHSLVIIDMQPEFDASYNESVQERIIQQIRKTKQEKGAIVLVEYEGSGETHKEITSAIGSYRKQAHIIKDDDEGGVILFNVLVNKNFPMDNLIVCGVNTEACVRGTVNEYLEFLPHEIKNKTKIYYLKKGCNSDGGNPFGRTIKRSKNIEFISN